jgi:hypothetical protein
LIWAISFLSLFIVLAALEVRNLFVAGSKLGTWLFTSSGWFRLISYLVIFMLLAVWFSTAPLGTPLPLVPFTAPSVMEAMGWIVSLLTTGSVVLAGIAFLTVEMRVE